MKKMELLFPEELIGELTNIRGQLWAELIRRILKETGPKFSQAAFILMVARISNCASCNSNSFRATQGCFLCSTQAIRRFRGSDNELCELFNEAEIDVREYFNNTNFHPVHMKVFSS